MLVGSAVRVSPGFSVAVTVGVLVIVGVLAMVGVLVGRDAIMLVSYDVMLLTM